MVQARCAEVSRNVIVEPVHPVNDTDEIDPIANPDRPVPDLSVPEPFEDVQPMTFFVLMKKRANPGAVAFPDAFIEMAPPGLTEYL
jgi:hypothetical protein